MSTSPTEGTPKSQSPPKSFRTSSELHRISPLDLVPIPSSINGVNASATSNPSLYPQSNVVQGMSSPNTNGELHLGLQLSCGEIHAKEAPSRVTEQKGMTQQASPWMHLSSLMIGSEGSMDSSAAQPVGMASGSITRAGYYVPPPAANKLAAAASDPLQLTIAAHVPAVNLNQLPPSESKRASIPIDTLWDSETANPFERPLLERLGRKDPPFRPVILESSEVAKEYAQREAANNRRRLRNTNVAREEPDAGPAKRKNNYRWPARTMSNLYERIEQLKKEALHKDPAERRPLPHIEAKIDELQAKKEEIHARMFGQQGDGGQGEGSSRVGDGHAPPPPGN